MSEALRTLIVDDEPLALERLQMLCANISDLAVIGTASNGTAALRLLDALNPDLVLLDMTMPEVDGLVVAREIARRRLATAIVFVTAHHDYAVEAFDLEAVDYVLKPVQRERLEKAIRRVMLQSTSVAGRLPSRYLDEVWIPQKAGLVRISVDMVQQIDAERDYVRLHTEDGSYLLLQAIAKLEEQLDPAKFIRIHRSTILRRNCIAGLRHDGAGGWSVELHGGSLQRVGRTYLPKVKAMAGR